MWSEEYLEVVGGGHELLDLLPGEDVSGDEVALGVPVLAGLGGGHVDDLKAPRGRGRRIFVQLKSSRKQNLRWNTLPRRKRTPFRREPRTSARVPYDH